MVHIARGITEEINRDLLFAVAHVCNHPARERGETLVMMQGW